MVNLWGMVFMDKITITLNKQTAVFMVGIIRQALISYSLMPKVLQTSSAHMIKELHEMSLCIERQLDK